MSSDSSWSENSGGGEDDESSCATTNSSGIPVDCWGRTPVELVAIRLAELTVDTPYLDSRRRRVKYSDVPVTFDTLGRPEVPEAERRRIAEDTLGRAEVPEAERRRIAEAAFKFVSVARSTAREVVVGLNPGIEGQDKCCRIEKQAYLLLSEQEKIEGERGHREDLQSAECQAFIRRNPSRASEVEKRVPFAGNSIGVACVCGCCVQLKHPVLTFA